jgi:hypothetical protein
MLNTKVAFWQRGPVAFWQRGLTLEMIIFLIKISSNSTSAVPNLTVFMPHVLFLIIFHHAEAWFLLMLPFGNTG